jgi:hypothetical protein
MPARLDKLSRLNAADQALLLRAFLLVAMVRISLWILPFRIVQRLVASASKPNLRSAQPPDNCSGTSKPSVEAQAAAVQIVSRYVPLATCLTQSMAAQILLARSGHSPSLRIGVLRADGKFKAHAWVECAGRIVIGDVAGIEKFKRFPMP